MSESGLCWVPDGDESPSKIGRPQQGRATWAPWSQVPVRGGGMEGEHLGPPQGSETSLQAFQGTCVLFFFLFTIIVTLVNPSMNRQSRLQRDRVWIGRERRHLCICSAAPAGQTARLPAGMGKNHFRGVCTPSGGVEGWSYALGAEQRLGPLEGWQSEAEAEVGDTGTALGASLATRTASLLPATQEGSRPGRETKLTRQKHPRLLPSPTLSHICAGR